MKRETTVVLDNKDAFNNGIMSAIADKYQITKVRMASSVHNAVVQNIQFNRLADDAAMKPLVSNYDPSMRAGLKHGDVCGWMFAVDVTYDDTLKRRLLIVESEPIPADKL